MADASGAAPFSADERDRLRALHAAGLGRNDIARELDRSPATVSKYAGELGLTFDRTAVQVATEARKADARARRSELEVLLLEDARRLRAQLWQPHIYIDHGGKEFVRVEWEQPEPTPTDKLKLMQATGAAVDRSLRLAEHDSDQGVEQAKSLLTDLGRALGLTTTTSPADAG